MELKWAFGAPAKIFESVWDATKLAVLGAQHGYAALYVVCGASVAEWAASESAELFAPGEIDALALWQRPLIPPRGPNYGVSVGADLEIGARGNRPRRAHARMAVRSVARCRVADDHELRAIGVVGLGPLVQWPDGFAPAVGANTRDLLAGGGVAGASHSGLDRTHRAATCPGRGRAVPGRTSQAWLERR